MTKKNNPIPPGIIPERPRTSCNGVRQLKDPLSPAAVRTYIPGRWPKIEVPPLPASVSSLSFTPWIRLLIAIVACPGQQVLAHRLQLPIFKVTTTTDESADLKVRREELNKDRYAALWRDNGELREDRGWNDWYLLPVAETTSWSPSKFVSATNRGLEILLPESLTTIDFDQRLTKALASVRLDRWVNTELGQRHLRALNLDDACARRFTAYRRSTDPNRVSVAEELVIFKPKQDISRLAALAERIVTEAILQL